jgi:putative membrane protein
VPLTNYLGWFFTVYVFLQLFALFLRFRRADRGETFTLARSNHAQPVVMYAVVGLTPVVGYLASQTNRPITDAAGVIWHTGSITESMATVTIFTMLFAAALAAVKLFQDSATQSVDAKPNATAATETSSPPRR